MLRCLDRYELEVLGHGSVSTLAEDEEDGGVVQDTGANTVESGARDR